MVIKVGRKDNEERWPTDSVPILWLGQGCSYFGLQLNMPEDSTRDTLSLLDRGNSNNFLYAFVLSLLRGMASLQALKAHSNSSSKGKNTLRTRYLIILEEMLICYN